jgi:hypothetical protein
MLPGWANELPAAQQRGFSGSIRVLLDTLVRTWQHVGICGMKREKTMRRCQRCRSTMLPDYGDTMDPYRQVWKCMGCGREMFLDPERQDEEDRQLDGVRAEIVGKLRQ